MNATELKDYLEYLLDADQERMADLGKKLRSASSLEEKLAIIKPVAKKSQAAAEKLLNNLIKSNVSPTISNIGSSASSAAILIALHSYLEIMQKFSGFFHELMPASRNDLPLDYLAVLDDRISLLSNGTQIYGTLSYDNDGHTYFVPIEDTQNLNRRRKDYNLSKLDLDEITQKPMSRQDLLLNFAYMDKKLT